MQTTLDKMEAFHSAPSAFSKLTPPPIFIRVKRNELTSLTSGQVEFTMWVGPIPIHWIAQHEAGPTEHSFADRQLVGPMAYWRHEHIFEQVEGGTALTDRVTLAHKSGWQGVLTRLMFDGIPLKLFFLYRHLRTRMAVT
jgi:ligand-binding SRPBCC domain-containing protein